MINIALFQPDIPQNVGATIRLCACLGMGLDIIEPCGFPWNEKKIRISAMDYWDLVRPQRHDNWDEFLRNKAGRVILMTTKTDQPYTKFNFQEGDILLAGQESSGAPDHVHESIDAKVTIPMYGQARSLNIVNATAMISGEALRQIVS